MVSRKRPAASVGLEGVPQKRTKKLKGLYEKYKGKAIPEPKLPRKPASGRTFKAVCWNVGGLRAILAKRSQDLQKLVRQENPSLLGFLEHKLQDGEQVQQTTASLQALLPDYKPIFTCSKAKKGYSGAAVLLRQDIAGLAKVTPQKLEKGSSEGRTLLVEMPKFFVVICYVPNSGDGLVRLKERLRHWDPRLKKYLQDLARKKPVLLLGDLNVAHRDADIWNLEAPHVPKSSTTTPEERASFGKLLEAGFVDGFAHFHPDLHGAFTYWSIRAGNRKPNRGLRLDYAVVSTGMLKSKRNPQLVEAFHLPGFAPGGDHCPVGATLSC